MGLLYKHTDTADNTPDHDCLFTLSFSLHVACKAVVHELKYAIKHTDQKKTIDVGSQRLRSDGSVDSKRSVQWAGSSVHVMELLEKIWYVRLKYCIYYALVKDC